MTRHLFCYYLKLDMRPCARILAMVSVSDACADERRRMGEIVRKGNTGVSRHGMRVTVSIKIASGKEEGRGYPDLPIPGIRVGREEKWVEDGTEKSQSAS